jgi:hypothetical protein
LVQWEGAAMVNSWVKATRSDGHGTGNDVYVNGNYTEPAGVIGTSFLVETGGNIFETLAADQTVDWAATETITRPQGNSRRNPVPVTLLPGGS